MATPRVFISYSRGDEGIVGLLAPALGQSDIEVWRDTEDLRAGELWPARLGEAIRDRDVVLLVWSARSAVSHFVELEWSIAIAQRRPVVLYAIDDTPLHPTLSASHAVRMTDPGAVEKLVTSIRAHPPARNEEREVAVIETLRAIPAQNEEQVARAVQEAFGARGWNVVVEGDLIVTTGTVPEGERLLEDPTLHPLQRELLRHVPVDERRAALQELRGYLDALWSRMIPLPLLAIKESGAGEDVRLSAVYTDLEVTAKIALGRAKAVLKSADEIHTYAVFGLELPPDFLQDLQERGRRGAELSDPDASEALSEEDGRRLTAVEAVAGVPRLVLLGPPGSGKSTFARFLALCMVGEIIDRDEADLRKLQRESAVWTHGALLPVFVELRAFVASDSFPADEGSADAERLFDFIGRRERNPVASSLLKPLEALARSGRVLFILDGLDETPAAEASRGRLKRVVGDLCERYPDAHFLLTSRPYAYESKSPWRLDGTGFQDTSLAPFDDARIERFVGFWYGHLAARGQIDRGVADDWAPALVRALGNRRDLRPLAERPLLLTMIADLHASGGGELGGGRADLFERSLRLLLDRWNEVRGIGGARGKTAAEQLGMSVSEMRGAIEELAYDVHRTRGGDGAGGEASEITAAELWAALDRHRPRGREVSERKVMDYLNQRAGVLMGESPEIYRFPHRSYQEYLAACHLLRTEFPMLLSEEVRGNPELWREVALLAAAQPAASTPYTTWALLGALVPDEPPDDLAGRDAECWCALFAGLALQETRLNERVQPQDVATLARIRGWMQRICEKGALPTSERAEAGRLLAALGDQRYGVEVRGDVPAIDWVTIPAGPFTMGSADADEMAQEDEKPQRTVEVGTFAIGRFPVTNAQYRRFVDDGGYDEKRWRGCWTDAGWEWKGTRVGPDDDLSPEMLLPNHPRVNVCWFEAQAFCRWLAAKLERDDVRLPAEEEWEKAARGDGDARIYPWGDAFSADLCNVGDTGLRRTTAVGLFPDGASPYGVLDMSGNVLEWCRTKYRGEEGTATRVLRGGSWFGFRDFARAAFRYVSHPNGRDYFIGFRVVCSSPISGDL